MEAGKYFCFYDTILFWCTKNIGLNSTHYFVMKTSNKREFQQVTINHTSDIDFKDFMKLNKKCIAKPYSFLNKGAILTLNNPLCFRRFTYLLERI